MGKQTNISKANICKYKGGFIDTGILSCTCVKRVTLLVQMYYMTTTGNFYPCMGRKLEGLFWCPTPREGGAEPLGVWDTPHTTPTLRSLPLGMGERGIFLMMAPRAVQGVIFNTVLFPIDDLRKIFEHLARFSDWKNCTGPMWRLAITSEKMTSKINPYTEGGIGRETLC